MLTLIIILNTYLHINIDTSLTKKNWAKYYIFFNG